MFFSSKKSNNISHNPTFSGTIDDFNVFMSGYCRNSVQKITRKYKSRTFPNTKTSTGKEIEVYVKSIGKVHSEYLVNFTYLESLLEEYGFALVKVESFEDSFNEMINNKSKNNVINILFIHNYV